MQENIEELVSKEWWLLLKQRLEEVVEMCKKGDPPGAFCHLYALTR
jgi:hypothetical protein